jgi:DNA replication initiation complex subunit (GINS family)
VKNLNIEGIILNIMNEVKITYETLFDLLRREKGREELQELDETFYQDVINYLAQKQSLLDDQGTQAGLFGATESEKSRIQIQNVKKIVKELYDRRESKILKLAINKSKTGSKIVNSIAMLPEEKVFFEEALKVLNNNRNKVLRKVLLFDNTTTNNVPKQENTFVEEEEKREEEGEKRDFSEEENEQKKQNNEHISQEICEEDYESSKIKVKFLKEVPKFIGKKLEEYGPFEEGDTAEIPEIITKILLKKELAETFINQ